MAIYEIEVAIPKLRLGLKTRLLQLTFLIGTLYAVVDFRAGLWLLSILLYVVFETLAGNIALHRYMGHRSFVAGAIWDRVLIVLATMIGVGSTISWVGQHAFHHAHADTPRDIHSPYHQGVFKIMFGLWDLQIRRKDIQHLLEDPWHRFFHKYYFRIHFVYAGTLFLISPLLMVHAYCIPNLMCLGSGYVLAILTHGHGYQTYPGGDRSTNSWLANVLTLGEGWHNNHHQFPHRLRQGEKKWEWDLPAFVVEKFIAVPARSRNA